MRRVVSLVLLACLALALAQPAQAAPQAERRVALIIGNGVYKAGPLKNPTNDARDMATALRELGFEVILRENAGLAQMEQAVDQFWASLKKGGTGLFFFAGHGLQVKGVNYLVPVDANIQLEQDVKIRCLDVNLVLGRMENAGNPLNLVILDACRNNPFARAWRNAGQGLAKMDAPMGTLIAYATAPDSVAADGAGKNGVYTQHLLNTMRTPGLKVEDVLKQTRIGVIRETDKRQIPWESSSLTGDFYFRPGAGGQAPPPPAPRPIETWREPVTGMEFVRIPAGCFEMGSPSSEVGRFENEGPVHEVCISTLWGGKYSVTVGQFRKFAQATGYKTDAEKQGTAKALRKAKWEDISGLSWQNPGYSQDDRHPAVSISWNDAQAYAQWLSGQGNGKYRLFTEAEWEYAARAGATTSRFWGDSPDDACNYANAHDQTSNRTNVDSTWGEYHNCDDGYAQTAPVGSFSANAFGLYDMLGNVWQWCEDVYEKGAYSSHLRDNPIYGGDGLRRVCRGGGWNSNTRNVRPSVRNHATSDSRTLYLGFRLVRLP